jgi:phosphoglycolate phosphatase
MNRRPLSALVTEYDALVYDLDGTLVELDVDWGAARARCGELCRSEGVDPGEMDLWDMLGVASDNGFRAELEAILGEFEREGARTSRRLALADELPASVSVAVCSLNAEAACRIALESHGLDGHVEAVVGRDTVGQEKPHPAPLLEAVERLGAEPGRTLFVGDSDSDAEAARRAGLPFQWVRDRLA